MRLAEKSQIPNRIISGVLRPIWRMRRGMTLGAQAIVIDREGRILLIRHGYRPGWHFPGGGVEWHETIEQAMRREVLEETGVVVGPEPPPLHGIFSNFAIFPGDHVAVFVVRDWHRPSVPPASREIRESAFVAPGDLPADIARGARRRVEEVFGGVQRRADW
ncbi:MAG: NUDIX domain-containing protein [Hyphomicrobiaceae bacterium]